MTNPNVLITGASATGKTTLSKLLHSEGYASIDADYDNGISYWENKTTGLEETFPENPPDEWGSEHHWKWKIEKLQEALNVSDNMTFVCGTAANCEKAYPLFDSIIVLTASRDALISRLATRTDNSFGKQPGELAWVLDKNDETVSKAQVNNHKVINTSLLSPEEVMKEILNSL